MTSISERVARAVRKVLARRDEALLVPDTSALAGDELIEFGDGTYIAISDLGAPVIHLRNRDGSVITSRREATPDA